MSIRITIIILAFCSLVKADDHPLYHIGKNDYIVDVRPKTSLKDLRDENKSTIVQFSAEWSTDCVKFWPYLYTLNRMESRHFKIAVIDMDKGWGPHEQFQREAKLRLTGVPYMIVLEPGSRDEKLSIKYHGPSGPVLNEKILPEIEKRNLGFTEDFIPAVQANWDNLFLPTLRVYVEAEKLAQDAGNNHIEARKIAKRAVMENL